MAEDDGKMMRKLISQIQELYSRLDHIEAKIEMLRHGEGLVVRIEHAHLDPVDSRTRYCTLAELPPDRLPQATAVAIEIFEAERRALLDQIASMQEKLRDAELYDGR